MIGAAMLVTPLLAGGGPETVLVQADPVVLLGNYGAGQPASCGDPGSSPLCSETALVVHYPDGVGPAGQGWAVDPRPVIIALRGGNSQADVPENFDTWFETHGFLDNGFVGIDTNYPIVDDLALAESGTPKPLAPKPSAPKLATPARPQTAATLTADLSGGVVSVAEDYNAAVDGVARLIQYVRAHAVWLNVDPDRVFVFGRSFGGFMGYAVALREDRRDPLSLDPVERESSRPDCVIVFSAATAIECFGPETTFDSYVDAFLPVSTAPGATLAQQQADSPRWWMENPQVYGRTHTPPLFLGYNLEYTIGFCGTMVDPHDGLFGLMMWDSLNALVGQQKDPALGVDSLLLDSGDFFGFNLAMVEVLKWCLARLAPNPVAVFLIPEDGLVVAAGQATNLTAVGASGPFTSFYLGTEEGSIPFASCPLIAGSIGDPVLLDVVPVQPDGTATYALDIPSGVPPGSRFLVQTLDLSQCEISNLVELYTF